MPRKIRLQPSKTVPDYTELSGVDSVKQMFGLLSNQRIEYTLRRHEVATISRAYDLPVGSRIREGELVGRLRNRLTKRECFCIRPGEEIDTRWMALDEGREINIGLHPKLARQYGGWITDAATWLVNQIGSEKLVLNIGPLAKMPNGIPDVYMDMDAIDDTYGTLGATFRQEHGNIDKGTPPYVAIRFDSAENWYYEFLFMVCAHELGHMLGANEHAKKIANLMYASHTGYFEELGDEDKEIFSKLIPA